MATPGLGGRRSNFSTGTKPPSGPCLAMAALLAAIGANLEGRQNSVDHGLTPLLSGNATVLVFACEANDVAADADCCHAYVVTATSPVL